MTYISGIYDYNNYLIEFLPLADIINLLMVNSSLNELVRKSKIYSEYVQLKKIKKDKILEYCYQNGLINILKKYYYS